MHESEIFGDLSASELELLQLHLCGLTHSSVGRRAGGLSAKAVKGRLERFRSRLGFETSEQMKVAFWVERGFLPPDAGGEP